MNCPICQHTLVEVQSFTEVYNRCYKCEPSLTTLVLSESWKTLHEVFIEAGRQFPFYAKQGWSNGTVLDCEFTEQACITEGGWVEKGDEDEAGDIEGTCLGWKLADSPRVERERVGPPGAAFQVGDVVMNLSPTQQLSGGPHVITSATGAGYFWLGYVYRHAHELEFVSRP